MQMRRRHWWNGKWGRLARRDVLLYQDDESGRWSSITGSWTDLHLAT